MEINSWSSTEKSRLKLTVFEKIAAVVISVEYFLCYNNFDWLHASWLSHIERFRWLDIKESNFWDTPEIFFTVMMAGYIASFKWEDRYTTIEKIKKFLPEISSALIIAYYTLGETILPTLLPGTPDIKDVPAVLITWLFSPILANYIRRNRELLIEILRKNLT